MYMRNSKQPDFFVNTILLGDYAVGKTSLLLVMSGKKRHRWNKDTYCPLSYNVQLTRKHKLIGMRVFDTGGQEKFRSLTASYLRGAHGCLVLFDVTKENTFDHLADWLHDLKEHNTYHEISIILVGTKCHVPPEQREVSTERAQKYADSVGLPYMEVSSEEGKNVTDVFEKLADIIIENITGGETHITSGLTLDEDPNRRRSSCSCS